MPPLTAEFSRSTGPATSNDSRRASRWRKIVSSSSAGEVRAHAEVLAEAEREVRVRVAVDAERERVVEHVFVAVRRREEQRDLVALADRARRAPRSPRSRCA